MEATSLKRGRTGNFQSKSMATAERAVVNVSTNRMGKIPESCDWTDSILGPTEKMDGWTDITG